MNVFNRILACVALVALLALAVVIAVFPHECVTIAQRWLENGDSFFTALESSYFWLFVVLRLVLLVVAATAVGLLLWAELRPSRPKSVRVHTDGGSQGSVTTDSVARRLSWHLDQLADVVSVSPQVSARGRSVSVQLDVETSPEIDVPMKTDEIVSVAREVITERMGLQLGKVDVRITHAPYRDEA